MKGVTLGICPDATLVDISHDIPAHDVLAGAFELAAAYRYFPPGTDLPGRRRSRRRLGAPRPRRRGRRLPVRGAGQRRADRVVLDEQPPQRVVELDRAALRACRPSAATFEGRDRFAPAAAWLAARVAESPRSGRPAGPIDRLEIPQPARRRRIDIGRPGAARSIASAISITNIDRATFDTVSGARARDPASVRTRWRGSSRPTPTPSPGESLRALRQHRPSRGRGQRRAAPPTSLADRGAARPCTSPAARDSIHALIRLTRTRRARAT